MTARRPMTIVAAAALILSACAFVLPHAALAETGPVDTEYAAFTVDSLAAGLAGDCGVSSGAMVVSARVSGLSDLQIADAFGRASATACDEGAIEAAFEAFKETSELDPSILNVAFASGKSLASVPAGDGFGGAGSDDGGNGGGDFDPPSGGSGGGGGSTNS